MTDVHLFCGSTDVHWKGDTHSAAQCPAAQGTEPSTPTGPTGPTASTLLRQGAESRSRSKRRVSGNGGYDTSSTAQGGGGSFKNRKPIGEIGCCESRMAERIH
jgi:hypothetical protein